jgi:hypothetical protein
VITEAQPIAIAGFRDVTTLPPLERIVQYGRELATAHFTLEFEDGSSLDVDNGDILFSRTQMTKLIAIKRGELVIQGRQADWMGVIVGLFKNASVVEEDPDEKLSSSVEDWLAQYADANASTDRDGAARRRSPFTDPQTKQLHINVDHFARWVKTTLMAQTTTLELRRAIAELGWQRTAVHYNAEGSGRSRRRAMTRYWRESSGAPQEVESPTSIQGELS